MSRSFRQLTEAQIRKAEAEGQFRGLAGEGRPLPHRPGDAFVSGADAAGFRIMAEAGALPQEIALAREVEAARIEANAARGTPEERVAMARLADLTLRHAIAREARQKFLRD